MKRLKVGDRIKLSGGYDMNPPWLKGGSGYLAKVTGFFDNDIGKRKGDERLSASIEFETEMEHQGFKGKYGFILGRWESQEWETSGTVHCHIAAIPITKSQDITENNSVWAESHAHYEVVNS
ncbi:MAG TPA: hypothetical protein VLA72_03850 [Anaerolineales bacterium]|nr:hypothetical protein [Anaerolineales bacterium]